MGAWGVRVALVARAGLLLTVREDNAQWARGEPCREALDTALVRGHSMGIPYTHVCVMGCR